MLILNTISCPQRNQSVRNSLLKERAFSLQPSHLRPPAVKLSPVPQKLGAPHSGAALPLLHRVDLVDLNLQNWITHGEINFCRERTFELEKVLRWAQDKYLVWMGDGYPDRKKIKTAAIVCKNLIP